MRRVGSILQVKNENTIIKHQLDILSLLCDWIFVIDDNSTDNTTGRIRGHKNNKKIRLIQNKGKHRNEGNLFNQCLKMARKYGCDRIYIADADEIVPPWGLDKMNNLLRNTDENVRLHRAELCLDQESYYGLKGTGKLVIVNERGIRFNEKIPIHTSQPQIHGKQVLPPPEYCSLLHYGTCDYAYQVFKCLSYIVWENKKLGKSYKQGYEEYFRTYENFVQSTENKATDYLWLGEHGINSPVPYRHYMDRDARIICNSLNVFEGFDIIKTIETIKKNEFARKYIFERA